MTTLTPEEQDAYDRARAFKNLAVVVALLGGIALALGWALVPSYYPSLAIGAVVGCTCIFASAPQDARPRDRRAHVAPSRGRTSGETSTRFKRTAAACAGRRIGPRNRSRSMSMSSKKLRREEVEGTGKLIQELLDAWATTGEDSAARSAALQITTSLLPEPILAAMIARVGVDTRAREAYWIPPPGYTREQWTLIRNSSVDDLMGGSRDEQ